jgi:alpha-beta hydrolase superfamily lysophospholipase
VTPDLLQDLRRQLPPFAEAGEPQAALQAFCRFYDIDFATRLPRVEHRAGFVHSGEFRIATHQWRQRDARANLLLLHGYFDHTGLYAKLIAWGLEHHCNVLIFDLPGHGLSTGEPAVIDDFSAYSRAIADVLAVTGAPTLPLWVMAQSTGCAALIDFAGKYAWPFTATVLLAPLIRPAGWSRVQAQFMLLRHFIRSVPRTFAINSSDAKFLAFLQRDPLQSRRIPLRWIAALRQWLRFLQPRDLGVGPALIIQGDADATVDWRYNVGFVQQLFPGSEVRYLCGAGHQLANESESYLCEYLAAVEGWLARHGITPASVIQAS